ncbi:site-specific integrase [Bacteroides thetaiotaomicron]|nr:site-specific integrase [Bacteroides thetaiotaomicron]MCE8969726.1 site-specific integrase [Bacteroides thetaiotaomicron]
METGNDLVAEPLQYSSDFGHSFKMKISEISLYFNGLRFHLSILPKSNYLPLCCFTGLAFADVSTLKKEDLMQDNNGDWWIRKGRIKLMHRRKASSICNIPLLPVPLAILKKYENNPVCIKKGCCLPVPCNQKMNSYLKEIADFCGIKKNITTHTARHTFGTTITLANNVPLQDVSVMLGHASTRMTQHYARVMNASLKKSMLNVKKRLTQ